ncbi:MAG TPA: hypothetical protein VIU62_08955 [Chloroflexota bacterium]|jgi:TfoX/Sxy family transcriptional regulator of competence genes
MTEVSERSSALAQERFDEQASAYLQRPGVTFGKVFHSQGLKVNGKIFALQVRGRLVVKLPATQAAALVAAGTAVAFEPSPGRRMKEWVAVERSDAPGHSDVWRQLMADAYAFVAALKN